MVFPSPSRLLSWTFGAGAALLLSACGSFDEVNLNAGDSKISFAQRSDGAFVRTDAGALGDLSGTLPEGVVPVGSVMSPQGVGAEPVTPTAEGGEKKGGGFSFGNITFRTAKSAERAAAREAAENKAARSTGRAADGDAERPGLLMQLLGMGGVDDSLGVGPPPELGADGLPLVEFDTRNAGQALVNKYLWNATAQTLAFMPLEVADQRRGLYMTGWYMDQHGRPERVRVDVQHTSELIGPGSFHVTVHRQVLQNGVWQNAPSPLPTARELESRILLAAQELKIADG